MGIDELRGFLLEKMAVEGFNDILWRETRRMGVGPRRTLRYVKRVGSVPLTAISNKVIENSVMTGLPPDSTGVIIGSAVGLTRDMIYKLTKKAYQGDLEDIALDPRSGMLFDERVKLLADHHRRKSRSKPEHPVMSIAKGSGQGAAFGGGALAIREAGQSLAEGAGLSKSLRRGAKSGLGGAIIGGILGAPVGLIGGTMRNMDIYRSKQVQKQPDQKRNRYLSRQVEEALGYTTLD